MMTSKMQAADRDRTHPTSHGYSIQTIREDCLSINSEVGNTAQDDERIHDHGNVASPTKSAHNSHRRRSSSSSLLQRRLSSVDRSRSQTRLQHNDQAISDDPANHCTKTNTKTNANASADSTDGGRKMNFRSTPLMGRQVELDQLHGIFKMIMQRAPGDCEKMASSKQQQQQQQKQHNSCQAKTPAPATLIIGSSGTGKSALVYQFVQELQNTTVRPSSFSSSLSPNKRKICFCQGKFQAQSQGDSPFGALFQIIQDFTLQMKGDIENVKRKIQRHMAIAERVELCKILPCLKRLMLAGPGADGISIASSQKSFTHRTKGRTAGPALGGTLARNASDIMLSMDSASEIHREDQDLHGSNQDQGKAWNRTKYLIHTFFRVICNPDRPLILFFDDLQWGTQVCLELLSSLIMDPMIHSCMFVGTTRSEGLTSKKWQNKHLLTTLQIITATRDLARIELSNFSQEQTYQWISHLLLRGDYRRTARAQGPQDDSSTEEQHQHQQSTSPPSYPYRSNTGEDHECYQLASVLHQRTQGNIFFLRQSIEELERKEILQYSPEQGCWEWNSVTALDIGQFLSNTAVEAVQAKIQSYPSRQFQHILCVASYTQASFDIGVLHELLCKLGADRQDDGAAAQQERTSRSTNKSNVNANANNELDFSDLPPLTTKALTELLEDAVLEGLLTNSIGEQTYRFAHDRIQQGAQSLVPAGEQRNMLRHRIGKILYEKILAHEDGSSSNTSTSHDGDDLSTSQHTMNTNNTVPDWFYFCAADHLNAVKMKKDRWYMIKLNVIVGTRAQHISALSTASKYFRSAFDHLKMIRTMCDPWQQHYELVLSLHIRNAEVEIAMGNYDLGASLANVVLEKAIEPSDKLSIQYDLATSLGRQDLQEDSLNLIVKVLQSLKALPKRLWPVHVISDLLYIKKYFKGTSNDEFLQLPLMTDPKKIVAMKFLFQGALRASYCNRTLEFSLLTLKSLRMTIKHGLCKYSGVSLVCLAIIVASSFADQSVAARYSDLSEQILKRTDGKSVQGWVEFLIGHNIRVFTSEYNQIIQTFQSGYHASMEAGDFEPGFLSWEMGNVVAYYAGCPLNAIVASFEIIHRNALIYKMDFHSSTSSTSITLFKALAGQTEIDWDNVDKVIATMPKSVKDVHTSDINGVLFLLVTNAQLCMYFRRPNGTYLLMKKSLQLAALDQSYLTTCVAWYFLGVACAGMYRETKQPKYKKELKSVIVHLERIGRSRGLKGMHRCLCLKAELLAISKTKGSLGSVSADTFEKIMRAYDIAITVGAKTKHNQDAGFACEMAGDQLVRMGRDSMASDYYARACANFELWESATKVDDLWQRCASFLSETQMEHARKSIRQNERRIEAMHCQIVSGMHVDDQSNLVPVEATLPPGKLNSGKETLATSTHPYSCTSSFGGEKSMAASQAGNMSRATNDRGDADIAADADGENDDDVSVLTEGSVM